MQINKVKKIAVYEKFTEEEKKNKTIQNTTKTNKQTNIQNQQKCGLILTWQVSGKIIYIDLTASLVARILMLNNKFTNPVTSLFLK